MSTVEQADLDRLSAKDKAELRQFVANEQKRNDIQTQSHVMTDICWKKCITGSVRSNHLDKNEQGCLVNCVDRFFDLNLLTMRQLASMRNGA